MKTVQTIQWSRTADAEFPYVATVDGHQWKIRINDFPVDEYKYTLMIDGVESDNFNDWPSVWTKPPKAP